MKISSSGSTRFVLLTKKYAIKLPRMNYGWRKFCEGLLANMQEYDVWRWNKSDLLCPVLRCFGGFISIMPRCDVDRHESEIRNSPPVKDIIEAEQEQNIRYKKWIDAGYGGDDKCDNYGYLNGRLVKIDYAS